MSFFNKHIITIVTVITAVIIAAVIIIAAKRKKNMTLNLKRIQKAGAYTEGKLYIDGKYFCDTLEDTERPLNTVNDKVYSETAIPAGTYEVQRYMSPKFQQYMPLLLNVPYFSGILIHSGTNPGHTAGCILVGEKLSDGRLNGNTTQKISKDLRERIFAAIDSGKKVTIAIH
jgi:hypothetical protein